MKCESSDKKQILEEIMSIKDWKHPFKFYGDKVVPLEHQMLASWNGWRARVSNQSISRVMNSNKFNILDLACNDGYYGFQLADKAKYVLGLDVRSECLRKAFLIRKFYGYDNYEFKQLDLRNYSLKEEAQGKSFDLVLCYGLLYHLTDPYSFLKSVHEITDKVLSLSTFLYNSHRPLLVLTKEQVLRPGSGLDSIVTKPTHEAVVRILYSVGFDLVLRYIPYKLSVYHHSEWGHFFGIKLSGETKGEYMAKRKVRAKYNHLTKEDQLVFCEDCYDSAGIKRIKGSASFKFPAHQLFLHKLKRKTTRVIKNYS